MQLVCVPDKINVVSWNTKAIYGLFPVPLDNMQKPFISGYSSLKENIIVHMGSGNLSQIGEREINQGM
jgi:hypothetical protein